MWKRIADDFEYFLGFPHCFDAINGKQVVFQTQ